MKKQVLLLLLTYIQVTFMLAQNYPVRVTPQVIPPYATNLSGYANPNLVNSPIKAHLILNDITSPSRNVRLEVSVIGNGIQAKSTPVVIGTPNLTLDAGIPLQLTIAELAPYFERQNLQGISSAQYNSSLPDGSYQFCFDVFDVRTGNRMSRTSCATIFLITNDPPFLNKPENESRITEHTPTNILFQWTPRHINVPNVSYEFSIVEVWDTYINPQAIFVSSPPLYQETTTNTTLLYGPMQPLLLPGKRYAWRVRAFTTNNGEEVSVFNNYGNSEIFWFDYQKNCEIPTSTKVEDVQLNRATISWTGHPNHLDYTVHYRESGSKQWYTKTTPREYITIDEFKPDTVYEYKIAGNCAIDSLGESPIENFRTVSEEVSDYTACGIEADPVDLSNQELRTEVYPNDIFTAGDFPVYIKKVTSSGGSFTGEGYISTPWLATVRIPVTFENIKINTDNKMVVGVVSTTYDPNWDSIIDADAIIEEIVGDDGDIDVIRVDADITDVQLAADGSITLITSDGTKIEQPGGQDVVYIDKTNETWSVSEDGKVTKGQMADGGPATSHNTNGVGSGGVNEITSTDVTIEFIKSGYYSYDKAPENAGGTLADQYDKVPIKGSGSYAIPYKAVSNIDGHSSDSIKARASYTNSEYTKDDIVFKTKEGIKVPFTWNAKGDVATLSLKKQFDFGKQQIIATIKPKDTTQKYEVAGVANLWHLASQEVTGINVTIVRVNNAEVSPNLQDQINAIYNPVGVHFNIPTEENLTIDKSIWDHNDNDKLDIGDSGLLAHYTEEERAIKNYFKTQTTYNPETYYIFVLGEGMQPSKPEVKGFMPLKRQYGFIFDKNDHAKTIAHELGHGVFGLEHPFTAYNTTEGATDLLIDYGDGTSFTHMDWKKMHAPGIQLYLFQDDEDGEYHSYEYYASQVVVPGRFVSKLNNHTENTVSFISEAGMLITLPNTVIDVTFNKKGQGTLFAFTLEEGGKKERYVSAVRYKGKSNESFAGYLKNTHVVKKGDWEKNVYQDEFSVKHSFPKNNVRVITGKLNNKPCGINLYENTIKNTTSGNWNSGGNKEMLTSLSYTEGVTKITDEPIESSAACDFCDKGKEFFDLHTDIKDEEILQVVKNISDLICDPEADVSFFEEFSAKNYNNLLDFQKALYDADDMWPNDLDAYKAFYASYNRYLKIYKKNTKVLKNAPIHKRKDVLRATYQYSDNQLKLLKAKYRAGILQSILNGYVGGYWTGGDFNHEVLVLNIIKTVNDEKETDQTRKFLEYLVDENYKVGDNLLYKQLVDKVEDSFLGLGNDNRKTLMFKLRELVLKAKGIELGSNIKLTSNESYKAYLAKVQGKGNFLWDVKNSRFLWVFNTVTDKSKLQFEFTENQKKINLKQFCTKQITASSGFSSSTICTDWKIKDDFDPFELIALTIVNDITFKKKPGTAQNEGVVNGEVMLVPAMFIDYLDRVRSNTQNMNGVMNGLTVASFYFSGSTLIASRGVLTWATFPAYADLFVTLSNPYFSDDKLFVAHAATILKNSFGMSEKDAKGLAKMLQTTWAFATIPLTIDTAATTVSPKKHIEAIATWKALVKKFGSVEEAKKVIAKDPEVARKMVKVFDDAESSLRRSSSIELDKAIAKKLKQIDKIEDNVSVGLKDDAIILGGNLANAKKYLKQAKRNDEFIDLVVHGEDIRYIINGVEQTINHRTLAKFIKKTYRGNKPIRLLSCSSLESAQNLSNKLGREVIACDGTVILHKGGGITTEYGRNWYKLTPGNSPPKNGLSRNSLSRNSLQKIEPPTKPKAEHLNDFIVLGDVKSVDSGITAIRIGSIKPRTANKIEKGFNIILKEFREKFSLFNEGLPKRINVIYSNAPTSSYINKISVDKYIYYKGNTKNFPLNDIDKEAIKKLGKNGEINHLLEFANKGYHNIKDFKKSALFRGVLAHELGHVFHWNKKLVYDGNISEVVQNYYKKCDDLFDKIPRSGLDLLKEGEFLDVVKTFGKSTGLNKKELEYYWEAVGDLSLVLTKGKTGFGRIDATGYYTKISVPEKELIAHTCDFYLNGNPLVEIVLGKDMARNLKSFGETYFK